MRFCAPCVWFCDTAFRFHGDDTDVRSLDGAPGLGGNDGNLLSDAALAFDNTGASNGHRLRHLDELFAYPGSESISDGLGVTALLSD